MANFAIPDQRNSSGAQEDLSRAPQKQTKAEKVFRALRQQIMTSELPPGSTVSERMLAERLDVGMSPVRVAIQRLAAEGFLAIEPRRGIRVSKFSVQDVVDLFQVRVAMEQLVMLKIAGQLRQSQIDLLTGSLQRYREAASLPDIDEMIEADFAFHRLLAEFHGNKQLSLMLDRTLDSLYREIRNSMKVRRRTEERLAEHQQIIDALVRGDAKAAAQSLIEHLESGQRFVMTGAGDRVVISSGA